MSGNGQSLVYAPWPFFSEDEVKSAEKVLRSGKVNYWTGEECHLFEKEFADYVGRKYAIALANGSLALELALIAYDIGEGDEVIVTSRTFMASASCIIMRGAIPVFADVDSETGNISPDSIKKLITNKTKAVICVHLAGCPCDMNKIMEIARKHNLYVIEDCAQAHGAKYEGKNVGTLGDIAAFSFCQDKIMTTGGEGGMLLTDDEAIFKKCWSYKDHGKSYEKTHSKEHKVGFQFVCTTFGTNWRMTELQAAIGRRQLLKLDKWVEKRREYAERMNKAFSKIKALHVPNIPSNVFHSCYKYYLYLNLEFLKEGCDRNTILEAINNAGVYCGSGSCGEVYKEESFTKYYGRRHEELPTAKKLADTSLMLQIHPTLTEKDIDTTIKVVIETVEKYTA